MTETDSQPIAENEQVKELLALLKENSTPGYEEFAKLIEHVTGMEQRLLEATEELKAVRQEMQGLQNHSLKDALQKSCKAMETNISVIDEFHLLLKGQTGSFSVEIWKRFRKWGGIPSGLTQNVKDLLASREIENIFENSDFIYMLNQAQGDRQILAKQLGISPHQLSYVTHSGPGEGLLFFGNVIIPFVDHFPKDTLLYSVLTTRPDEVAGTKA